MSHGGLQAPDRTIASAPTKRWLGLVLLVPAVLALLFQQVIPGVRTLAESVAGSGWSAEALSTGWDMLSGAESPQATRVLATALAIGVLVAILGTGLGLWLGVLLRHAPLRWQRIGLAILGVALLSYGPGSLMLASPVGVDSLPESIAANWQVAMLWGSVRLQLAAWPLLVLLGALAALLVRATRVLFVVAAVIAVGGSVILAEVVLSGPAGSLGGDAGWAVLSVLLGLLLAVLGVVVGLLLHGVRPRFDLGRQDVAELAEPARPAGSTEPAERPEVTGRAGPAAPTRSAASGRGLLAVVSCAVVLTVLVLLALPWLSQLGRPELGEFGIDATSVMWHAMAGSALELVLTVAVTGSAAIALGYLQVLGRRSLTALLLVSPWFFIGWLPLIPGIAAAFRDSAPQAPFYGLSAPLLCVPLLFLLTYLADGVRRVRSSGSRQEVVAPAALAVISIAILAVVRSQDVLWELSFTFPDAVPSPVVAVQVVRSATFGEVAPVGLLTPVPMLLLGAVVCAVAAALVPGFRVGSAASPVENGTRNPAPRPA